MSGVSPSAFAGEHGARAEVRDLFYATPARLKFMKSERSESLAITEEVKRQAMAHEAVGFALDLDGRKTLRLPAEAAGPGGRLLRLAAVLGREFEENAILIDQTREGVRLSGYAGLPTYSRGNAAHQYLFVNGRPVRDRLLHGALRAAYADFLARDRHPIAALYLELDPQEVDVNVHPAKSEVRFRDPNLVRGLIIGSLKHALAGAGHRASTTVATSGAGRIPLRAAAAVRFSTAGGRRRNRSAASFPASRISPPASKTAELERPGVAEPSTRRRSSPGRPLDPIDYPLGAAARPGCTKPMLVAPRRATALSSSISTRPTNAWSTSA